MKKHKKTIKLRIFKKLSKSAGKSISALVRICFFPTWHPSVSHKNSAKKRRKKKAITLGNDFPATDFVWVWISCTASPLLLVNHSNTTAEAIQALMSAGNSYPHSSCCRKVPYHFIEGLDLFLKPFSFERNFERYWTYARAMPLY